MNIRLAITPEENFDYDNFTVINNQLINDLQVDTESLLTVYNVSSRSYHTIKAIDISLFSDRIILVDKKHHLLRIHKQDTQLCC